MNKAPSELTFVACKVNRFIYVSHFGSFGPICISRDVKDSSNWTVKAYLVEVDKNLSGVTALYVNTSPQKLLSLESTWKLRVHVIRVNEVYTLSCCQLVQHLSLNVINVGSNTNTCFYAPTDNYPVQTFYVVFLFLLRKKKLCRKWRELMWLITFRSLPLKLNLNFIFMYTR